MIAIPSLIEFCCTVSEKTVSTYMIVKLLTDDDDDGRFSLAIAHRFANYLKLVSDLHVGPNFFSQNMEKLYAPMNLRL